MTVKFKPVLLTFALAALAAGGGLAIGCRATRPAIDWNAIEMSFDRRYGPRDDAPGEGTSAYSNDYSRVRHDGHLCHTHRTGQFCDIVTRRGGVPADTPVYVNIHGGAWSEIADKDGEDFSFLAALVERGFVVVNMNYAMQEPLFHPKTGARAKKREGATYDTMLRDIDRCVSYVKHELAPSLGLKPERIAIGGGSAGAHLACLYAYDQALPERLSLGLRHELEVGFVVDVVGPTDLASEDFSAPLLKDEYELFSMFNKESCDRMVSLFGYLVDVDLRALLAKGDLKRAREVLARYSPLRMITPKTPPTILAYCRTLPWSKTDGCVPASTFYEHCQALAAAGVPYAGEIRSWRIHGWLRDDFTLWLLDRIAEFRQRFL